jgi:dipeptidyl aminopeptidase/acylaminoacyl peptidase
MYFVLVEELGTCNIPREIIVSIRHLSSGSAASLVVALLVFTSCSAYPKDKLEPGRRAVNVRDAIQMTRLADQGYFLGASPEGRVGRFSPDGKRFTVVLQKGLLGDNTNEFSVLLFETSQVFRSPKPNILLTMLSSSNRMAIRDIQWLGDNKTIAFIGENPNEIPQVYTFNIETHRLEKKTNHLTPVVSYDIIADGNQVIFEALPPSRKIVDSEQTRRKGIVISTQYILELLAGDSYGYHVTMTEGDQLFFLALGQSEVQIPLEDRPIDSSPLLLAPDGRHALVEVFVRDVPREWNDYQDETLHRSVNRERAQGVASSLTRYMLVDTRSKTVRPLLDAPSSRSYAALWAEDGKSVVISGTYLPLDALDRVEQTARMKNTYVVEVGIPDKQIVKITDKELKLTSWDKKKQRILLKSGYPWKDIPPAAFEKIDSAWKEIPISPEETTADVPLNVTLEEDMNSPPRIFALDPQTQQRSLLLDLNPQFKELQFGKVESISWKATDGHEVQGGLYLPPDYAPFRRYPLVIQTHGFTNDRFRIDGPWSGAFAAQPLAAKGFIVLQVGGSKNHDEDRKAANTPNEALRQEAAYEGAVDYLDGRGLIDRNRVGIIGFSRTVYPVGYTLTHSKYKFSAATLADGIDGGYFQYVAFYPVPQDAEFLNGGPPFGDGLSLWLKNAPTFSLNRVNTPVRIEAYGPGAVLEGWEWFSGLSRLRRPVDFIYLPDAPHLLVKPWERLTSQEGNVDWFTFWLKREEDPEPGKITQYLRWRELREQQDRNEKNATAIAFPDWNSRIPQSGTPASDIARRAGRF